ncbi:hypothetical protein [Pandoraea sp.]|uniref:hypothetical protein n=1 Tax=Pandoraea sp. TaxID=1883445 RepID=UPI0035B0A6E7
MKLILLALAASLLTLVLMVQTRGEANDVALATASASAHPAGVVAGERVRTRKDMALWNARRKMHAVRQDD